MNNLRIKTCLDSARTFCFLAEALQENYYLLRARDCLVFVNNKERKQTIDEDTDVLEYKKVG